MPCTATIPNLTAREQAHQLYETIPPGLFRVADESERIAWRVSPEPFALSPQQVAEIERLGLDLYRFYRALNNLYNRSVRGTAPSFIADYLDRGKPEQVVKLARQNRFKQELPGVIRPDLIITDDGFAATELDSIPGRHGIRRCDHRGVLPLGNRKRRRRRRNTAWICGDAAHTLPASNFQPWRSSSRTSRPTIAPRWTGSPERCGV